MYIQERGKYFYRICQEICQSKFFIRFVHLYILETIIHAGQIGFQFQVQQEVGDTLGVCILKTKNCKREMAIGLVVVEI